MIHWDPHLNLLMADSMDEAKSIAHPSGPRQVGVIHALNENDEEDVHVYVVFTDGEVHLTHAPDHWGVPAWHSENDE